MLASCNSHASRTSITTGAVPAARRACNSAAVISVTISNALESEPGCSPGVYQRVYDGLEEALCDPGVFGDTPDEPRFHDRSVAHDDEQTAADFEEALKSFEAAVIDCPSVVRCFLMSGSDDYIVIVLARDIEDFERIHRTELSRLPKVARIQSSFAMREVVNRAVPPVIFGGSRRRGKA